MRARRLLGAAGAASVLALLVACAAPATTVSDQHPTAGPPSGEATAQPGLEGELTIFAAASLQGAFDELATAFEAAHPSLEVRPIVFDGSTILLSQLVEGAAADVFATADERTMSQAVDAGLAQAADLFAANTLVVVVPAGNPGGVDDLDDLGRDDATVVLCAPEVPCGGASARLLERAGVSVTPASVEQNVTAVLTKVAAGEADAALVYATDVRGMTEVESFVPDGAAEAVNRYPIAALSGAHNPAAADAFVAFVLGPQGQRVLAAHGFGRP